MSTAARFAIVWRPRRVCLPEARQAPAAVTDDVVVLRDDEPGLCREIIIAHTQRPTAPWTPFERESDAIGRVGYCAEAGWKHTTRLPHSRYR